jgi:DNA-binding NarL/FixJ family response regulator
MSIRVVLVDDTVMFRDGLRLVLELQSDIAVVGEAANGVEGLEVVRREQPDVVLMDIRMPLMDGVEATRLIRLQLPGVHVLILTTYSDDDYIAEALKAGAVGYLLKDMPSLSLIQAIRAVHQGGVLILPPIAAKLVADHARLGAVAAGLAGRASEETFANRVADLTPRESEVLTLVARGLANREIADRFYLTEGTVKNHISAIYSKLHARDRAQAIAFALRQGLVDTGEGWR